MKTALFKDKRWQQHGDYWLLIGKSKMPAAILISIAPPKEELTRTDEPRITAKVRCVGD